MEPLVSICCITYNQAEYLRRALDGFLAQQCDFAFEVILHDDASTDGTTDMVREYAARYPEIVRAVYQSENQYRTLGLALQYHYVFPLVRGKYIAICEGDDYWNDPSKLQQQVDFLEEHPDYGMVFTKAAVYCQASGQYRGYLGKAVTGGFEQLIRENTVSNQTACFRRDLFERYIAQIDPGSHPEWVTHDYPAWLWMIDHAKFHFIDRETAVYRVIVGSVSNGADKRRTFRFFCGVRDIVYFYLDRRQAHNRLNPRFVARTRA
ncbi:MAG: glycosyltransferase [Rikenellaceae bacterium]|jgi:glycosyltransferase involved in cell wall biosynthesis|nr:glycosyltransferase [Rikenellaceae bacterium]